MIDSIPVNKNHFKLTLPNQYRYCKQKRVYDRHCTVFVVPTDVSVSKLSIIYVPVESTVDLFLRRESGVRASYMLWLLLIVLLNQLDRCVNTAEGVIGTDDYYGSSILPYIAEENWLQPSLSEVGEYYNAASIQCNKELESYKSYFNTLLSSNFAPIYSSEKEYSKPQSKCRGRDFLYYVSGMMIYPFGPTTTDKECNLYSTCWYGLLACGTPNYSKVNSESVLRDYIRNKIPPDEYNQTILIPDLSHKFSISSVYIHQRIVGDEIIVPDSRFFTSSIISCVFTNNHSLSHID